MKREVALRNICDWFEYWFDLINARIHSGAVDIRRPYSYPNFLRFGETPAHFAFELTGAMEMSGLARFKMIAPTTPESHKNVTSFIVPGWKKHNPQQILFGFDDSTVEFRNLAIASHYEEQEFEKRLNKKLGDTGVFGNFPSGSPFYVNNGCPTIVLSNIDLVSTELPQIFYKRIHCLIAFKKSMAAEEVFLWLDKLSGAGFRDIVPYIFGMNHGYPASRETFAAQLLSLAHQDVNEPVLDSFIAAHAEHFAQALGYKQAVSQVTLEIKDGNFDGLSLRPDYLMLREDGKYDIVDLKRALTQAVVIGSKSRLRFSHYVYSLVAQLDGYRRYFATPENAKWAYNTLGISLADAVRLVGIVGNHNNFTREDVDTALCLHREDITIISYSELVSLLRNNTTR
jgi:hypothetical protein